MNLINPYGDGNHRRISLRREWAVDLDALTATHRPTGFAVRFEPLPAVGYLIETGMPADMTYNTSVRVDAKLATMVKP